MLSYMLTEKLSLAEIFISNILLKPTPGDTMAAISPHSRPLPCDG